jgi:hypothetical protein
LVEQFVYTEQVARSSRASPTKRIRPESTLRTAAEEIKRMMKLAVGRAAGVQA